MIKCSKRPNCPASSHFSNCKSMSVDPPAAPKCSLCEHESLFSDGGTIRCKKPVRTETARDKSTAETHAEDFTACGCKCVFAPPAPDEADKALAHDIANWAAHPSQREALAAHIAAALAQARKQTWEKAIQAVRDVQENFATNGGRSERDREQRRRQMIYIRGLDDARGALESASKQER